MMSRPPESPWSSSGWTLPKNVALSLTSSLYSTVMPGLLLEVRHGLLVDVERPVRDVQVAARLSARLGDRHLAARRSRRRRRRRTRPAAAPPPGPRTPSAVGSAHLPHHSFRFASLAFRCVSRFKVLWPSDRRTRCALAAGERLVVGGRALGARLAHEVDVLGRPRQRHVVARRRAATGARRRRCSGRARSSSRRREARRRAASRCRGRPSWRRRPRRSARVGVHRAGAIRRRSRPSSFSGRTTAWQRSPVASPFASLSTVTPASSSTSARSPCSARTVPGIRFETPMKPATKVVSGSLVDLDRARRPAR